jgi:DNA polymerase-3 subunit alpha
MRLVESYEDHNVITIEGRTFPSECLVEDDDGIRIAIVADLTQVSIRLWAAAHTAGARMLVSPDPQGEGWIGVAVETYMDSRTEHHPSRSFRLDLGSCTRIHTPSYRALVGSREAPAPVRLRGFVHLHTHSEFSPLDGLSTVQEMVDRAVADDQPALAITDHGVCAAHPHLQRAAEKAGIKPIFGIEANFTDDRFLRGDPSEPGHAKRVLNDYRHLILWAANDTGLRNLWAMSTEANREGFYGRPRMDWETLQRLNEGVMASTACLRGPLAQRILEDDEEGAQAVLARLLGIFGDRLYVELHTNQLQEQIRVNEVLVAMAQQHGLPTVAVVDSHYPCLEDRHAHRVWIAAQTKKDLQDEADLFAGDTDYHLMSEEEVRKALAYLGPQVVDEAVGNTLVVADACDATVAGKVSAPVFSKADTEVQAIQRDVDRLIEKCLGNWVKKCVGKIHDQATYEARFEREMRLLITKGFCGYFLMVSDYCTWAREHGILVGPGRGSGSGSLVAYLADITEIDPVETDLMFERFLTEGRTALPDFDVDFPTSKRSVLTNYIIDKYGRENVVRVGTHIRLKNKGVVRDLARVLKDTIDIHYPDIDAISAIIEAAEADKAGLGMSWGDLWDEHEEVLEPFRAKYPVLFEHAGKMVGRLKSYGKHPAGVVIAPDAGLVESFPMRQAGEDLVIEFDMDAAEALGLVKFDLLTLRTLDTIQMAVDLIREQRGDKVNVYDWVEEYRDPQVWDEISDGHTLGIFQIETPGGTRDTKRFRPQSVDELADVITLVRPGPKRSGLTETYFRRKVGEEPVSVLDPRLDTVLATTYGCPIYQEQVINICRVLGGYTSEEADEVRRLLGKKKVEQVAEAGRQFHTRCVANGTDPGVATIIWEQLAEFAKYSFNRSHAYGYALLGYWTAWLKFHYPVQFLTAVLSTVDKGRIPEFINEARRMGYRVLPPDVNVSGEGFSAGQMEVRYGLDGVKGIGKAAVEAVVQGQPYTSWDDFMQRKGSAANAGVLKTLAKVGAFDSLVDNRRALERRLEWETDGSANRCQFKDEGVVADHGLPCLFDWDSEPEVIGKSGRPLKRKPLPKKCAKSCRNWTAPVLDLTTVVDYTDEEVMEREMELLGVHLSATPFDRIPDEVYDEPEDPTVPRVVLGSEVEEGQSGEYVVAAIINKVRPHVAKNGKEMGFISLYARNADLDVTVFNEEWTKFRRDLRLGTLCFAAVRKNTRGLTLAHLQPL